MATRIMQIGGLFTLLSVGVFIFVMWRRDRRRRRKNESTGMLAPQANHVGAP
jgi:preprotein translocase subunit YajC